MKKRSKTETEVILESLDAARARAARTPGIIAAASETVDSESSDGAVMTELADVDTGITAAISESPAMLALYTKAEHIRAEVGDAKKDAANLVMKAIKSPPVEQMSKLEKTIRRLKWIIGAVAVPGVTAITLAGHYVYSKAVSDTRAAVEQELLIKRIDSIERRLDDATAKLEEALDLAKRNKDRIDDEIDRGYRHEPGKRGPLDPP